MYTQLISFATDEYTCRVAKDVEEARVLIESGFDYVMEIDGYEFFKKRK